MTGHEIVSLGGGVHAFVQPDGGWCLNNAGFVGGPDRTVVIDTAATERRARALKAAVAATTGKRAGLVVNTHFHGDHTFGNNVFTPEAVVVAHREARVEMAVAGLALTGMWPDVDWGAVSVELPTLTYTDRMTIHLGELSLELIHPGPAHTTTDTVVWIPERRVLFAGDVLMNGVTPFCLMGSVAGSLRTIAMLRALEPETIVAGHGPVGGPEVFDQNESYLRWLQRVAAEGVVGDLPPLELAARLDLAEFATLLDSERLVGNLHRAYSELHGEPEGTRLDVPSVFAEMVRHHGRLPACYA